MDLPYWYYTEQGHYINTETIKHLCFQLLCILKASKPLCDEIEDEELEEGKEIDTTKHTPLQLYNDNSFEQISHLILQLALMIRTYDDQMMQSEKSEQYRNLLNNINDSYPSGSIDGKNLSLRKACNKIIHAQTIAPVSERIDRSENIHDLYQDLNYLTGEIDIKGIFRGKEWACTINLESFIEAIVDIISKYRLLT